jgi:hypothetical protein
VGTIRHIVLVAVPVVVAVAAGVACSSGDDDSAGGTTTTTGPVEDIEMQADDFVAPSGRSRRPTPGPPAPARPGPPAPG